MAIIAGKAELILICLVTVAPQEFAPPSLELLPFLWLPQVFLGIFSCRSGHSFTKFTKGSWWTQCYGDPVYHKR